MTDNAETEAPLTEKQERALAFLRTTPGDWKTLDAVADVLESNRRSAGIVLGALERRDLVLRWEPIGPSHPRFTSFEEVQHDGKE